MRDSGVGLRGWSSAQGRVAARVRKERQAEGVNDSLGPFGSLESRTAIAVSAVAISTQSPPLAPLWVALRQTPTSMQLPPLSPL